MANAMSKAEQNALAVSYDVMGTHVELDLDFVKRYLVRGNADKITDQELVFFMNTCKMQKLNPLVAGEAYCIKFGNDPAQMVVGKGAYLRRAFEHPDYLGKEDGITVKRGNEIIMKEGTCVYPGEVLLGGWCRVHYRRFDKEYTAFKELSLEEYNKGMANWKTKPATMVNKCAISQCVREAFPKDYEGIYSEDEMVASGVMPVDAEYKDVTPAETAAIADKDPVITNNQRQEMFKKARDSFGDSANAVLKNLVSGHGHTSTTDLRVSEYKAIMAEMQDIIDNSRVEPDTKE